MVQLPAAQGTAFFQQFQQAFLNGFESAFVEFFFCIQRGNNVCPAGETDRDHQVDAGAKRRVPGIRHPLCQAELRFCQNGIFGEHRLDWQHSLHIAFIQQAQHHALYDLFAKGHGHQAARLKHSAKLFRDQVVVAFVYLSQVDAYIGVRFQA